MTMTKLEVLRELSFGRRVAEDEVDELASYFVRTEQWRQVETGQVDIVFGTKGAGKSAIYSTLLSKTDEMFDNGIILIPAEKTRGTPAFRGLQNDPPTTEVEFVSLWKMYILSLIGSAISEYGLVGRAAKNVAVALAGEGLLPASKAPLVARVQLVLDWVRRALSPRALEAEVKLDPVSGMLAGIAGKITLGEPSSVQRAAGAVSVDSLLALANSALEENDYTMWVVFDRLDVAFSESRELEANALRALFKCYLDLLSLNSISPKIFLRTDIWDSVVEGGFREASHITRSLTIEWSNSSLLNLIVRRMLSNNTVVKYLNVDRNEVLADVTRQRAAFDSIVPDKIDVGRNPLTFEWILGRAQDGKKTFAPREVIHLLTEAQDIQVEMLVRGEPEPLGAELFTRQAFREALMPVSNTRLEQTIYAEYPELKSLIAALKAEKAEQTLEKLTEIWKVAPEEATKNAERLVEVGVFEARGTKAEPRNWVPFLYRPALHLVQGAAG